MLKQPKGTPNVVRSTLGLRKLSRKLPLWKTVAREISNVKFSLSSEKSPLRLWAALPRSPTRPRSQADSDIPLTHTGAPALQAVCDVMSANQTRVKEESGIYRVVHAPSVLVR